MTAVLSICLVCGFKAHDMIEYLTHAQDVEFDDQHQRWLSAAHGTGLKADLDRYKSLRASA